MVKGADGCVGKGGKGCADGKGWRACGSGLLPPDCCQLNGCCWDNANARFRGHALWHAHVYGHSTGSAGDCAGDLLADIEIEFDYAFPQGCGSTAFDTISTPSDIAYFTRVVRRTRVYPIAGGDGTTWQTLPWATGPDANLQIFGSIQYVGSGVWWVFIQIGFDVYEDQSDHSDPTKRMALVNCFITGTSDDPAHGTFGGDCLGVTDAPAGSFSTTGFDGYHGYSFVDTCATYSLTALAGDLRNMMVANNYCCNDEGVCVASALPNLEGSGDCP